MSTNDAKIETGSQLVRKKHAAIAALLTHASIEKAAISVGISEKTLWRWLQLPEFSQAYQTARDEVLTQSLSLMHKATGTAVATLIRNLKCGNPSVEVRAAIGLLDQTYKGREHLETEARLAAIEKMLEETGAGNQQQRTGYHRG
jgi:hypothetical protein